MSKDGRFDLRGRQVDVIRLEGGPTLILAEFVPPAEWDLGKSHTRFPAGLVTGPRDDLDPETQVAVAR